MALRSGRLAEAGSRLGRRLEVRAPGRAKRQKSDKRGAGVAGQAENGFAVWRCAEGGGLAGLNADAFEEKVDAEFLQSGFDQIVFAC